MIHGRKISRPSRQNSRATNRNPVRLTLIPKNVIIKIQYFELPIQQTQNDHLQKRQRFTEHLHFHFLLFLWIKKNKSLPKVKTYSEGEQEEKLNIKHGSGQRGTPCNTFYLKFNYSV